MMEKDYYYDKMMKMMKISISIRRMKMMKDEDNYYYYD